MLPGRKAPALLSAILAAVVATSVLVVAAPAHAADVTVTSLDELRAALADPPNGDIDVAFSIDTITITVSLDDLPPQTLVIEVEALGELGTTGVEEPWLLVGLAVLTLIAGGAVLLGRRTPE